LVSFFVCHSLSEVPRIMCAHPFLLLF
jgi:hypothetical protein